MAGSSKIEELPPQHQVFINFHGVDLRQGFIRNLVSALKRNRINVFNDNEVRCILSKRIEESRIALVVLSTRYTESPWCVNELAQIMDCVEKRKLVAVPIFYKLDSSTVRYMRGQFGYVSRNLAERDPTKSKEWENALMCITNMKGFIVSEESSEDDVIKHIVKEVEKVLKEITSEGSQKANVDLSDSQTSSEKRRGADLRYGFVSHFFKALESYINRSQLGMKIACLLLLFFVLQQIAYMSIGLIYQSGAMDGTVENVQKLQKYIPTEGTKNPIDKYIEFPTGEGGAKTHSSTNSDTKTTTEFLDSKVKPPQIQVFLNFRGEQLRYNFIGYLVDALRRSEINVFIDNQALRGEDLNSLFKRIEDSGIAIVVFSSRYTESTWCLEELVKIKERVHQGHLKVLPIFYKVSPTNVKRLKGDFGDHFRDKEYTYESDEPMIKRWKEAIAFVSHKFALTLDEKSIVWEIDFVETIVKEVLKMLQAISTVESGQSSR